MWGKGKQKPAVSVHFDTLIAEGTLFSGDVEFTGGLHVDGVIKGHIRAVEEKDAVVRLSEVGRIEGDVVAPHVIINGQVQGDVYASEHLELAENASITGNVYYNLIEMVIGAEVNGNLVHDREQAARKLGLNVSDDRAGREESGEKSWSSIAGGKQAGKTAESGEEPGAAVVGGKS